MISTSREFRNVGVALDPIHFKHVYGLFDKAFKMAQDGDLEVAKKLSEICVRPEKRPGEEVGRMLRDRHLSHNWWGWDALGVGKSRRGEYIKEYEKGSRI